MNGHEWAFEHDALNEVLAKLQQAVLSGLTIDESKFQGLFVQAGWLATFLANSPRNEHRRKALLFAALTKKVCGATTTVDALCYTIFGRVGALPAAMHLPRIVGDKQEYIGPSLGPLSDEFRATYEESFSELGGGRVLTEFQKSTAEAVRDDRCGIISAPTSAGKSFIIHEYVKDCFRKDSLFVALFIVPTKALIAQTCAIYRRFCKAENIELSIYSSVPDDMAPPTGPVMLALTQERCIRLLSTPMVRALSLVFADEIQSLEKGDRGALLDYILHEIKGLVPSARLFAAGPFISNGREIGRSLFGEDCQSIETELSPVSQIVTYLTPVRGQRTLKLQVVESSSTSNDVVFDVKTDRAFYSRWKSSSSDAVCDAIRSFANGSPSIVYARGPGTAQRWAQRYSDGLSGEGITAETNDLIVYLRDSIHPKCSLIRCLARRVAYHHGRLPDFVREEIEELFIQRDIDVLFCTSTLLEGVNLPADKMFIASPAKATEKLTTFEFKNLTGRAGRLDQHLCGIVYCVCIPNDDAANQFDEFRGDTRKEVLPTVDERLATSFESIRSLLANGTPMLPDENAHLRGTVTVLRSRFLRGREHAEVYLKTKRITEEQRKGLLDALNESVDAVSIPPALALKNPYIDPVLQDKLYRQVSTEPGEWAIRAERGFSTDFENVFKRLNDIFHIIDEIKPRGNPDYYRYDLLTFSKLWLRGKPFKEIVNRALPSALRSGGEESSSDVDQAIRKAMDFITK